MHNKQTTQHVQTHTQTTHTHNKNKTFTLAQIHKILSNHILTKTQNNKFFKKKKEKKKPNQFNDKSFCHAFFFSLLFFLFPYFGILV